MTSVPDPAMETRVDFHQLATDGPQARELYACRLADKALRNGFRVLLLARDDAHAAALDDLLWSFSPEAFLPHGRRPEDDVCVATSAGAGGHTLLVNLRDDHPELAAQFARVVEIVPADPAAREGSRAAYRRYQQQGFAMHYHDLGKPRPRG